MPAWVAPALAVAGTAMGAALAKGKDERQIKQQALLQNLAIEGNKKIMDYGQVKQMEMWEKTGPVGQMEQYKKSGLNPALMYGMGGGGGQSVGGIAGGMAAAHAPGGSGREQEDYGMMGMQLAAQLKLLQAQKENIEADTDLKKTGNIKTGEEAIKLQLENVINEMVTNLDENGNPVGEGEDQNRLGYKERVQELKRSQTETEKSKAETKYKIDENKRQEIMNSATVQKFAQEIELMKKQGKTQEQIENNMKLEGKMKQLELEWMDMGLTKESLTKFIQLLILKAF